MQPIAPPSLRIDKRAADAPVPFEIPCVCGHVLRGVRQSQAQTVQCPSCQAERFILPRSPLPAVVEGEPVAVGGGSRFGRRPIVTALAVGSTLVVVLAVALYLVFRKPTYPGATPQTPAERFAARSAAGRAALADGSFQQAVLDLKGALDAADRAPGLLSVAERKEMTQQQRQAAIVADLLSESLADVVRNSIGTPETEWQNVFTRRYAGRSLIHYETIHRDAGGNYHGEYRVQVTGAECRIDRKALKILKDVDLSLPQRVLIGFRLASLRRDPQGGWTASLDPDSGVFLTDPVMLKGLSIPDDADAQEVMKRQKAWVNQLP
jgi:hypothetical protein